MKALKSFFAIVILFSLVSCNFNSTYLNREEDKKDAEKIADQYYALLKDKKYDEAFKLFDNQFWTVTPKAKVKEMYAVTEKKLGELQTITLDHFESKVVKGTNPSSQYILYYLNKYQKYDAKETLSLMKAEDGKIKIIAFNINSEAFFK